MQQSFWIRLQSRTREEREGLKRATALQVPQYNPLKINDEEYQEKEK